ncbi:membrane-bound lytic murein transglycosylase B [Amycolatopsis cihanbeyliensis]|uniref:Membrane-bound lytic murein transglycosylase B n=1 Tax=Amycolatopsis cihanbeyliensis TaxID=1128664 RepID=A0A542DDP7_AMYCI|nr:membrane-bound lytic murein transglycosylase B [Amycolatopsis cihanbeyliensis]
MRGTSAEAGTEDGDSAAPEAGDGISARRRGAGILGRLLIVASVLAVGAGGVWVVTAAVTPEAGPTTMEIPALEVAAAEVEPGSVAPVNTTLAGGKAAAGGATERPDPPAEQRSGPQSIAEWAARTEPAVGVPARALMAYGHAELALRSAQPGCRVSWATLAGIGRIESNHGRYGGAVFGADGRPSKPIIGVPLDGSPGVKAITDTDGGRFDGDARHDRAVGPMQFIPSTWARYAADGNGDGRGDPQQIDDAALAAAHYLCADGRDMAGAQGWWAGVMSYNHSVEYAQKVFGLADRYAKAARGR